jgi:cytochrome P450
MLPFIHHCCVHHRANDGSQFGYGARTCIGKNISLLELTKLMPQLLRQIDFVPVHEGEWSIKTAWFVKQKYEVQVRLRDAAA